MTTMQQLSASQANKELRINENFEALSAGAIYSKRHAVTSGLTWGYHGGLYNGATVADGTVTQTDAADNYVVVLRSSGVVSVSTSSANSLNALYAKLYKNTCAGGVVTVSVDQRMDTNGLLFDTAGGGGGSVTSVSVTTANGVSGTVATATTTPAITLTLGAITPTTIVASGAVSGSNLSGTNTGDQSLAAYATSAYVDAALAGLSWKQAVRAATTANGTLANAYENGDTIDGVVLATGDRILLKNQTAGAENGIYLVAASGAPTRTTDANSSAELVNASVYVSEGTTLADTQWTCSTNAPITVDTTALAFAQLNSGSGTTVATDVIWDAAGDLVQGTGSNTAARLALGTALQVLRVNAGATAAEWAAAAAPTITPVLIQIACSDETTALTTGVGKVTFRAPYAFTITDVRASVTTAPTGGTLLTVDVNDSGTTILSTKLTFDASEKTTTTAATPRVISDSAIADDAEITIDIDAVGSSTAGAGLKVALIGTKP